MVLHGFLEFTCRWHDFAEQAPVNSAEQALEGGAEVLSKRRQGGAEQAPVGGAEQAPVGGSDTSWPNDP